MASVCTESTTLLAKDEGESVDPCDHQVDTVLLNFSKRINQKAFLTFAVVLVLNFVYFVMYCVSIRRVFIFPVAEHFYFNVSDHALSGALYTANWVLLICVIATQISLQEMCINWQSVGRTVLMFLLLNMFGTINSILISYVVWPLSAVPSLLSSALLSVNHSAVFCVDDFIRFRCSTVYPLISVLNYTNYYRFKSRVAFFVNNILPIDPESDQNDKYLRLIAVNHFLSKLCFKLQSYALQKKGLTVNNVTVYHKLHQTLDRRLRNLGVHCDGEQCRAEFVYKKCIQRELDRQKLWHRLTFRLYAVAINVSLIRLLFFSEDLDLFHDHKFVFIAFWVKTVFEMVGCGFILMWCLCDERMIRIKQNELRTRFYYIVLKLPEFRRIDDIVYEHLLSECDRFYQVWKFSIESPATKRILKQSAIYSVCSTVCEHIFEIQKVDSLDIDETFWKKITTELDQD